MRLTSGSWATCKWTTCKWTTVKWTTVKWTAARRTTPVRWSVGTRAAIDSIEL